jgi:hypothetical protein
MRQGTELLSKFKVETSGEACRLLAAVCAVACVIAVVPAAFVFGPDGIVATIVSAAACLASGCIIFWVVGAVAQPRVQAFAALGGMLVRSVFALVAALGMQFVLGISPDNYLIWLGLFYMLGLAVETVVLLKLQSRN